MRLCDALSAVRPAFGTTTTIIGIRIRMSALTYAKPSIANRANKAKKNIFNKGVGTAREHDFLKAKP